MPWRPDSVTRGGAKVAAERQPVAPGKRRTAASIAATSLILSSMVVRLSGRNRITTSSGTVAPSFSSSQRVMGMTGVLGREEPHQLDRGAHPGQPDRPDGHGGQAQ